MNDNDVVQISENLPKETGVKGVKTDDLPLVSSLEYLKEAEKPIKNRSALPVGRHNSLVVPRRYGYEESKIDEIRASFITGGATVINPIKRKAAYWGFVEALIQLDSNKWHDHGITVKKMKDILSEIKSKSGNESSIWDKFSNRSERSGSLNPKDLHGRIMQNARVLQRLGGNHQYGLKLQQFKMSIDIHIEPKDGDENRDIENYPKGGMWYYKLNTLHASIEEVVPLYENKVSRKRKQKAEKGN